MSTDIAEAVGKFTEMDRRLLVVKSLERCINILWVPVMGIIAMTVGFVYLASGWMTCAGVLLGGVSGYFLVSAGQDLCSIALQLLQRNLDECKALGPRGGLPAPETVKAVTPPAAPKEKTVN